MKGDPNQAYSPVSDEVFARRLLMFIGREMFKAPMPRIGRQQLAGEPNYSKFSRRGYRRF
jgi:hypothetical protein